MEKRPQTGGSRIPWGRLAGIALLTAAGVYASQHPHSIFYYLVKFLVAP
jgi:LPXTG-motif cell wall-anchored protein